MIWRFRWVDVSLYFIYLFHTELPSYYANFITTDKIRQIVWRAALLKFLLPPVEDFGNKQPQGEFDFEMYQPIRHFHKKSLHLLW